MAPSAQRPAMLSVLRGLETVADLRRAKPALAAAVERGGRDKGRADLYVGAVWLSAEVRPAPPATPGFSEKSSRESIAAAATAASQRHTAAGGGIFGSETRSAQHAALLYALRGSGTLSELRRAIPALMAAVNVADGETTEQ